jgi:4-amino-4-deoxychorismate lyase
MKYCSINGKTLAQLDTNDRGLAYGDGLFTTAKIVNGRIELVNQHVKRLIDGCDKLNITLSSLFVHDEFVKQLKYIAKEYTLAVLKVIITAGAGGRGYSRIGLNDSHSNVVIMVFDYPTHYDEQAKSGITLGTSEQKMGVTPMLAGIKHLNRLEQVMLKRELDSRIEDDFVVMNVDEQVIEATSANLFYWLNNRLYTPDVSMSGVDGVMRQFIMNNYPKYFNSEVSVLKTSLAQLEQADAIFICNSIAGVMPVREFNNRPLNLKLPHNLRLKIQELLRG